MLSILKQAKSLGIAQVRNHARLVRRLWPYSWRARVIESLLMISKVRGYQRGWVYHQFLLMNESPSITELGQLAYCPGYKAPWAEHRYQEIYSDSLPIPQEEFVPPDLKLPDLSRFNIAGMGIPQPVT
jgi:hypothetical protein